ncbi:MAG: hypothetical protein RBU37_15440 [Myxococcota bacterium]|jgi:hypothetical protein|nr:hypothetical protein [Myxococcota bacterium]
MKALSLLMILCPGLLLVACGDDEDAPDRRGIYAIQSWTQNATACDSDGEEQPDAITETPWLIIDRVSVDLFGFTSVQTGAATCKDDQDCLQQTDGENLFALFTTIMFPSGSRGGVYTEESFSGGIQDGQCSGTYRKHRLSFPEDKVALLERLDYDVSFPSVTEEDYESCEPEAAAAAAKDAPCSAKRLIKAALDHAVPSR